MPAHRHPKPPTISFAICVAAMLIWGQEAGNRLNAFGTLMAAGICGNAGWYFYRHARSICASQAAAAKYAPAFLRRILPPASFRSRWKCGFIRVGGLLWMGSSVFIAGVAILRFFGYVTYE